MNKDVFYKNNKMTAPMESYLQGCKTFEDFEKRFPDELLADDNRVGEYLEELILKYRPDANYSKISDDANVDRSYVGNIVRGKKNNPGRDALISICLALGTTIDEVQYLLMYAGHAPLYVRRKRDVIIWFGFMMGKSINDVEIDLEKRNYQTLQKLKFKKEKE